MSERFEIVIEPVEDGATIIAEECQECGAMIPADDVVLERHATWHRRLEQILTLLGFNW
jgi:hypothetical protein